MGRNRDAAISPEILNLVRALLQPYDDGGKEMEGILDADGCLRCTIPLINGMGQEIGRLILTQTRIGRSLWIAVKVGGIMYRNLEPQLRRMGMRLRLRWRERRAES